MPVLEDEVLEAVLPPGNGLGQPTPGMEGPARRARASRQRIDDMIGEHNEWQADPMSNNARRAEIYRMDFEGHEFQEVNLDGASFYDCDFRGANFLRASLRGVPVWACMMEEVELSLADLTNSHFNGCSMANANLFKTKLQGCSGNRMEIKSFMVSEFYPVTYTSRVVQVGCRQMSINAWTKVTVEQLGEMDGNVAKTFYTKYKDLLVQLTTVDDPAATTRWERPVGFISNDPFDEPELQVPDPAWNVTKPWPEHINMIGGVPIIEVSIDNPNTNVYPNTQAIHILPQNPLITTA